MGMVLFFQKQVMYFMLPFITFPTQLLLEKILRNLCNHFFKTPALKTAIIGDVHGRPFWKKVIDREYNAQRYIFVGDYFDNVKYNTDEQIYNFQHIIAYKMTHPEKEVVMLIGNHDYHYFPEVGNTNTAGYQAENASSLELAIKTFRKDLQVCYQFDDFLISHAGVSSVFMDNTFGAGNWTYENIAADLNNLFNKDPMAFRFNGTDPSGDDPEQGPMWIRTESLVKANRDNLESKCIQIFGHTKIDRIHRIGKITKSRYQLIDTLGTSGEYLVIEDGSIRYDAVDIHF